jgi:hypothetical protein
MEGAMARLALGLFAFAIAAYGQVPVAQACGGFFCGRMPVDQTAERIVFKVNEDTVTMIVQISYSGAAEDFAWVLPLGTVPDVASLDVFPQRALTALDANTGPQFSPPTDCPFGGPFFLTGSCLNCAGAPESASDSGVTVHYRAEVGPYDVAAIESEDPMALFQWLRDNEFNVNDPMLPYIHAYTDEGMKFLALKLQKDAATTDIQPFRFDLPGTSPSIPLRMTALAAEPEMSLLVFVFGDERYNGANWPEVTIEDDRIVWKANVWPIQTNWTALVARGVDEAGGQGWVTELAGATEPIVTTLQNSAFNTPEDEAAGAALLELIGDAPRMTRLYSRLSPEEMTSDPIFRRDDGGDVSNVHMLSRLVDGVDLCPDMGMTPPPYDPCLFTSCGAGGICRPVQLDGMEAKVAGCGCIDGATARTTFDPVAVTMQPDGTTAPAATVVCQDARMSFVNPGDVTASGVEMLDPCQTFDCGPNGECLAINMTPTCVCDRGFVALGSFADDGARATRCEQPTIAVPDAFYAQRLPDLPPELPGGRLMEVDPMRPVVEPSMDDLGSKGMPVPDAAGDDEDGSGVPSGAAGASSGGGAGEAAQRPGDGDADDDGGCAVRAAGGRGSASVALLWLLGFAWLHRRRNRR